MKAEVLNTTSSSPVGEVNYKLPVPSRTPPVRHWRRSIALSLGVLVLMASVLTVAISLHSHASPSSKPSNTAAASSEDNTWYALGYVDIEGSITHLYPMQGGRVKSIKVKENQAVKAGDALFLLEDTVPLLKVRQAQIDLEGAQKQLAIAQAGVDEAEKQIEAQKTAIAVARKRVEMARIAYDKQRRFEKDEIGDKQSTQAAKLAVELAELGVQGEQAKLAVMEAAKVRAEGCVAAAKVSVEGKHAQLDEARNAVNECVVRAPDDGTPLRILINKGEVLGANPRQPAIEFAAKRPLLVRGEVEQEFVGRVKLNQEVVIEDSVTEKEIGRGTVASIARWYAPRRTLNTEMLPTNNDTRTVECVIPVKSPAPEIRLGQRVRLKFHD